MENGKEKARKVAVELIETGIMMNGEQLWMELEGIASLDFHGARIN